MSKKRKSQHITGGIVIFLGIIIEITLENILQNWAWFERILLIVCCILIICLIYFRHYLNGFTGWLKLKINGTQVLEMGQFVNVLHQTLITPFKKDKKTLTFYNIPLSTLKKIPSRKKLWEEAIALNRELTNFVLILDESYEETLRDNLFNIDECTRNALTLKTVVPVLIYDDTDIINFACVIDDTSTETPKFASSTIMVRPFWNGLKFDYFFAFSPSNNYSQSVIKHISSEISNIWLQIDAGKKNILLASHYTNNKVQHMARLKYVICNDKNKFGGNVILWNEFMTLS